uniref:Putative inactive poly [ADP-ribose] polymerase SRO2 n=1 Tax=Anthurium amnicola TaxID=1678845 RepID=A0A1D1YBD6_9ARAE
MAGSVGRDEEDEQISCGSCISDSESTSTGNACGKPCFGWNGLKKLEEGDEEHVTLKHRFYSSLGAVAKYCPVVAVYKNMHGSGPARDRLEAFQLYSEAMKEKRGGDANIRNAWYGASKDGIGRIVQHGFDFCGASGDGGSSSSSLYGLGVCLSPDSSVIDSVVSSVRDEDGLRHLLLCCVILGNTEEIGPHSGQLRPSTDEFDSGVDSQKFPKKYFIWPSQARTHILPLYVLSIKLDLQRKELQREPSRRPTSPWIPFTTLVPMLSARLPAHQVCLIRRFHNAYMERKITRQQLVFQVRLISGDKLLLSAIKAFRGKQARTGINSSPKKCKGV